MAFGTEVASLFGTLDLKDNATKTLEGFGSGLDAAADKLKSIGSGLIQTGSQLTLLTAPITAFLATSIKAASDQQAAQSQLQTVLKSTAGVAGVTQQAATDLANSLSRVTRFSDDATLGAENMLLTFTSIGKDIFPDVTKTALDMSQALGQDLKSSAIQLGKALNDPTQGMTALRRVGVQFTDAQEKQIKTMQASGDLMGAQSLILKELQREFGGSAEAAGKTFAGQMDILNHRFQQFQEKIGGIIMPLLGRLMDKISPLIDKISDWVDKNPQLAQTILIVAGAVAVAGPVLVALGIAISGIGTVVGIVGGVITAFLSPIGLLIAGAVALTSALGVDLLGGFRAIGTEIGTFVGRLQANGGDIGKTLRHMLLADEDGSSLFSTVLEGFGMAKDQAQQWGATIGRTLVNIGDAVGAFVKSIPVELNTVVFSFKYYFGQVQDKVTTIFGQVRTTIGDAFASIQTWIDQNIIAPIKGIWTSAQILLQPVLNWFNGSGTDSLPGAMSTVSGWISQYITTPMTNLWTTLQPILEKVAGFVAGLFQPVLDFITKVFNQASDTWEMLRRIGGGTPQRALPGESSPGVVGDSHNIGGAPGKPGKPSETPGSGSPLPPVTGTGAGIGKAARAFGGPVSAGQSYIVGERGPERFTPSQSGMITPNNRLGGTSIDTVNFNFPNVTNETKTEEFRAVVYEVLANL